MDFEWQSRAPMDESSPFAKLGMAHENKKRECRASPQSPRSSPDHRQPSTQPRKSSIQTFLTLFHRPGTHSAFDSPPKKEFPGLRPPNSQPFLFNQPRQPEPPTQPVFSQAAFMTPRKVDVDFSSGAENMSSPENADNEDTPEQPARTERRNSLFNIYGRFAPSPGRGQIPRAPHYSTALFHKVQKRRQRNKALGRRVLVDSDDEDSDRPSSGEGRNRVMKQTQGSSQPQSEPSHVSSFSSFFALLEAHPTVPSILSWWAQLAVNILMMGFASWIVWSIVAVIRADFAQAAEEVREKTLAEMAACTKSYLDNRCAADNRLPALHTVCDNWDRCMNQDPDKVGQAQVSAKTMARIINSFIDPISYKSMVCDNTEVTIVF